MRKGNNPNKGARAKVMPGKLATVTTHLPNLTGYHAERLGIVKACLVSMRKFADVPVMVWDNGSCAEFRAWLLDEYKPDYVMLSANIGKHSARAAMIRGAKPETIISFSDDDMLFYPGWWSESETILRAYPNTGAVSAWPLRVSSRWGIISTLAWANNNADTQRGKFTSQSDEIDYAESVGLDTHEHLNRIASMDDYRLTYNGVQAYAAAQHCQFMTIAERLAPLCEYNPMLLTGERAFDDAIDNAGFLRLTTVKRLSRHMGNVLDDKLRGEIMEMGLL